LKEAQGAAAAEDGLIAAITGFTRVEFCFWCELRFNHRELVRRILTFV
jgi:hypothetical protein